MPMFMTSAVRGLLLRTIDVCGERRVATQKNCLVSLDRLCKGHKKSSDINRSSFEVPVRFELA